MTRPKQDAGPSDPRGLHTDGAVVRALRRDHYWTQEELAERAGVTARTVANAEAGRPVSFRTLRALAENLGVPVPRLCRLG